MDNEDSEKKLKIVEPVPTIDLSDDEEVCIYCFIIYLKLDV